VRSQTTNKKLRCAIALLLVPALLALGGCVTADVAMKLAPELAATTALPVAGRDQWNQLAFGRWHVAMPAPYRRMAGNSQVRRVSCLPTRSFGQG
jgi:hypothetical protein